MSNVQEVKQAEPARHSAGFIRRIDRRIVFGVLGLAGIGAALYVGWGWLAAAGLTTFIVALLPCAVMCGLGLCASRFGGQQGGGCHGGTDARSDESTPGPNRTS